MSEDDIQRLLNDAAVVFQQGDTEKAVSLYENIITKDPNNAEAHMKLADLYIDKGLKDKASTENLLLGNAYYESRLFKNALKYFQKVLELDPSCIDARIRAAEIYVSQEMEREAKLEYLAIAEHYLSLNDLNKSEEYSKQAINLKSIEAHYIMGIVYFKRGMWKEAVTEFEILTKIKINHTSALLYLGLSSVNLNKFNDAVAYFSRILKNEPENIDAMKGMAEANVKKGSFKEGVDSYLAIVDTLIKGNNLEDAQKIATDAVKVAPTSPDLLVKLGYVYEKMGKTNEAVIEYNKSLELFTKAKNETRTKEIQDKINQLGGGSKPAAGVKLSAQEPPTITVQQVPETPHAAVKQEPVIERFTGTEPGAVGITSTPTSTPQKEEVKIPVVEKNVSAPSKPHPMMDSDSTVTPLTEAKGSVDELFELSEKHMKDSFYEKAIEIYRVILKKEPRNTVVRQKLHQAYLLLAQQEEEMSKVAEERKKPVAGEPKKERKSKISYL